VSFYFYSSFHVSFPIFGRGGGVVEDIKGESIVTDGMENSDQVMCSFLCVFGSPS
jgi:hypothetical protein